MQTRDLKPQRTVALCTVSRSKPNGHHGALCLHCCDLFFFTQAKSIPHIIIYHIRQTHRMADSQTAPPTSSVPGTPGKNLWKEYTHQDGRKYYHHTVDKRTVWEKPEELKTAKEVTMQKRQGFSFINGKKKKTRGYVTLFDNSINLMFFKHFLLV